MKLLPTLAIRPLRAIARRRATLALAATLLLGTAVFGAPRVTHADTMNDVITVQSPQTYIGHWWSATQDFYCPLDHPVVVLPSTPVDFSQFLSNTSSPGVAITDTRGFGTNLLVSYTVAGRQVQGWEVHFFNWNIAGNQQVSLSYTCAAVQGTINDTDGSITYGTDPSMNSTSHWAYFPNRGLGDYQDDVHATDQNGDYVLYQFYGTGISYIAEKDYDFGVVNVTVDGTTLSVDCTSTATEPQQVLLTEQGLSLGWHYIKVQKVSGAWMTVDGFIVYP